MADLEVPAVAATPLLVNVADRLAKHAQRSPERIAVVCRGRNSSRDETITFGQLDADATTFARGLADWGITPGMRLALLVRPGIDFVTLVFALLRAGAVMVLVDPGLGRKNLVRCLAETEPDGFVAIPPAQAVRTLLRNKFSLAKWNVTVGRRWFWGGPTLDELRQRGEAAYGIRLQETRGDAPAAIIFTSGSTGPPKGVLYTHRMFDTQVAEIQSTYHIEPGGIDLSCFPLFALFNSAMGVTTVLPDMHFSRPASADPKKLLAAANDWKVTQAFASPAVWRNLGEHCAKSGDRIDTLRRIFSCGAPVSAGVLRSTLALAAPNAQMHTPYGATECLPVATIEASEVLGETAARTDEGAGVCVGRKFDSIEWRVIRITDEPIASIDDTEELPAGEIGELIVRGPQASPSYVTRMECNADAKISSDSKRAGRSSVPHGGEDAPARFRESNASPWHRMGDVGYLDDAGRFWYCGRKSHRVVGETCTLFAQCIEGIFDAHPDVKLSALIGIGRKGEQIPVVCILPSAPKCKRTSIFHGFQPEDVSSEMSRLSRGNSLVKAIEAIVFLPAFPVDVRHNAKILRDVLQDWASQAIVDDFDLYSKALSEQVWKSPTKATSSPPFVTLT